MARVSIHRCKIERWSTFILAQIWSLYGHVARGEYSYVFNAGMERNAMVANPTIYPRVLGRECISLSLSLCLSASLFSVLRGKEGESGSSKGA